MTGIAIAMRGGGYYSSNTAGAKAVIDSSMEQVRGALGAAAAEIDAPMFAMADFGAADGGTSLDLMRQAVDFARGKIGKRPITLTYTDLPDNDFSVLFRQVHGGEDALGSRDGLFVFASATSFYRQIFPADHLAFGFSATAMHWLSRSPGAIPDHTHAVGAVGEMREAYRRQALADWESILLHRARELRRGGRLVLINFCADEHGRYLGHTGGVNMHDEFHRQWRALLLAGLIGEEEYRKANFQQYYKTKEEFAAPLLDPDAPAYRAGLRLEFCETRVFPCPYAAAFRRHGRAREFAAAYVPTLRSWSERVFLAALAPDRPMPERRAIVDRFYAAYEDEVARAPDGHAMDYVHCYMTIRKE